MVERLYCKNWFNMTVTRAIYLGKWIEWRGACGSVDCKIAKQLIGL
jgi:hypothetical protein